MNQGIRGIELLFAGWMLALTTYYLGTLDTGSWVPLAVTGVEILGLSLMLTGIGQISNQHKNYKVAGVAAAFLLVVTIGMGTIQVLSLEGITDYMAIAAICLTLIGDILFLILTGLILLGLSNRVRIDGSEREANQLAYLWALFLTFAILYLAMQAAAVLLIHEGLTALTFVVPATGLPLLIIGTMVIVRVRRIFPLQLKENK